MEMIGPLHGIPYGLKEIYAVPEYKTTWGSTTLKDQVLDAKTWIYKRYEHKTVWRYLVNVVAHGPELWMVKNTSKQVFSSYMLN